MLVAASDRGKKMNVYTMYFSPTGGTKRVAGILAREFGAPEEMDFSLPHNKYDMYRFEPGDVCFAAVPSFGGRAPGRALENLTKVRAKGAAAIVVVSYGNRAYEDALLELRKAMEGCGFRVVAGVAAVAEHSILRQYGAGRPDEGDQRALKAMAGKIREKLLKPETWNDFFMPGRYPYRESPATPMVPKAGKNCKGCGICADRCPAGAISKDNPRETDGGRCISCMRCVAICPEHERRVNRMMLLAGSMMLRSACSGRKNNELFL